MDGSEITMDWLLKGWQGNKTCDGSASYWGMGLVGSLKVIAFYTEIYKKWRWSPFSQSRDAQTEIDKKWTLLCTICSYNLLDLHKTFMSLMNTTKFTLTVHFSFHLCDTFLFTTYFRELYSFSKLLFISFGGAIIWNWFLSWNFKKRQI